MKNLAFFLTILAWNLAAHAGQQTFDFKDPKQVNNVVFQTDAPLESINGMANGISGKVDFDPANPAGLKGKIIVDASSLRVPNTMMQGHLQSANWLDVKQYPEITFEAVSLANVKTEGDKSTADVTGTLTLHGVSKKITAPGVEITFMKDKLKDRFPALQGDLLRIRAKFSIKRGDFNINKGQMQDKVSDVIALDLNVAGQAPH